VIILNTNNIDGENGINRIKWKYIFAGFCLLIFGFSIYKFVLEGSFKLLGKTEPVPVIPVENVDKEEFIFPTKAPEEIELISQVETNSVEITETAITPTSLTIKPHDQVFFSNKTKVEIKIVGKNWGGIPIGTGENMSQPFNEKGEFNYKIEGLEVELEGVIKVV